MKVVVDCLFASIFELAHVKNLIVRDSLVQSDDFVAAEFAINYIKIAAVMHMPASDRSSAFNRTIRFQTLAP